MKKFAGFTLVELMVAMAIVGLLLAIALPSYQSSVRKTNRADAQISLSKLSALQERYYFQNNQYTGDFANLVSTATSGQPVDSDEDNYSIALTSTGSPATAWSMTATAQGSQADDTECATFTLTSLGLKTATSADCW